VSAVHRYYDPTIGEFLTVDPDVAETQQPYYYAGDDPVNRSDPSGEFPVPGFVDSKIGGSVQSILNEASREGSCTTPEDAIAADSGLEAAGGITANVRVPDYVSFEASFAYPIGELPIGPTVAGTFTDTRYGSLFFSLSGGVGIAGLGFALRAGWILSSSTPSYNQVNNFVHGWSFQASFANIFAGATTYGNPFHGGFSSTAVEVGLGYGGDGGTGSAVAGFGWHIADRVVSWNTHNVWTG
jgi:hypothetical protein